MEQGLPEIALRHAKPDRLEGRAVHASCDQPQVPIANEVGKALGKLFGR